MKLAYGALIAALICGALALPASGAARSTATSASTTSSAAAAENGFALSLLDQLGGTGNVVYSPYSVDLALTMADAGAGGPTASQIAHVLHARSATDAVANAGSLRGELAGAVGSGANAPTLDVANALWTQSGLPLGAPFVSTLTRSFGAPPQQTDFAGAPAAALRAINSWVSGHTDALIPSLLGPGSITPQTDFVLANSIYVKAHWQSPFARSRTEPAPFTTASGKVVRVPFMNQDDTTYRYASGSAYQAIELPYSSSSLSLLAIMPRGQSLTRFGNGLTAHSLARIVRSLSPVSVDLSLPKLDLSSQESLNRQLERLGMTDAFSTDADFRGITTARSIYISLVEHAAVLKVDEQGTVAAGATAVIGPTAAVPEPHKIVKLTLDHPYLLLLRDDASGTILFVARVADPSQG